MRLPSASSATSSNPARAFSGTEPPSKSGRRPSAASWVRMGMSTDLSVLRPPGSWIETRTVAFSGKVVSASAPVLPWMVVKPAASVSGTVRSTRVSE